MIALEVSERDEGVRNAVKGLKEEELREESETDPLVINSSNSLNITTSSHQIIEFRPETSVD